MRKFWLPAFLVCGAAGIVTTTLLAQAPLGYPPAPPGYTWELPGGWPTPLVPADNPMSPEKVELGRYLFYDTRLSGNGTQSCASCHEQAHAFADTRGEAKGSTGQLHPRGSMSLVNIAYARTLTWADPTQHALEAQALVPMYGTSPIVELGLRRDDNRWLDRLRDVPEYRTRFPQVFGAAPDPFTVENVARALASFERSIISARSPYDRYADQRDDTAISASARRGEVLYHSQPLSCFRCHGGFTFSAPVEFHGRVAGGDAPFFQNNGLYNLAGPLTYPSGGRGLFELTGRSEDMGKFKAPTLRNIAVTAPYMHDGSIATLGEVLDHYAAGGRTIASGPHQGVGRDNPVKSPIVGGFPMSPDDRRDLVAFLESLTDAPLLHDPRFANPWPQPAK